MDHVISGKFGQLRHRVGVDTPPRVDIADVSIALRIGTPVRSVGGMKRQRFAALFQQVHVSGFGLAMKLQLESIDQKRLQHLAQMFIFDSEPGIQQSFDAGLRLFLQECYAS
jgi:hypothetical protein